MVDSASNGRGRNRLRSQLFNEDDSKGFGLQPERLLPGAAVLGIMALCARAGGVGWLDFTWFMFYVVVGLVMPGTLLWRVLGPALRWRAEEYALGAAVGYAMEVAARIVFSWAGSPRLAVGFPVFVIAVFVAVPVLRRRWLSRAVVMPVRISWAYACMVGGLCVWLVPSFFASQPLTWSDGDQPTVDLTFILALAADVSNHWPPEFPYVLGEPLQYHWFYAAHLAAAHAATGIELPVLVFRLALLLLVPVLVLGTGALATRLARRAWAGPLGAFLAWVVTDLTLQRLSETATTYGSPVGSLMGAILWWSPTQTFSNVLLIPAALLTVDVLRHQAGKGHWLLLALLSAICAGAKGSSLPVLIGGVAAAAAVGLLNGARRRTRWRPQLPALGLLSLLSAMLFAALVVLYGGKNYGLTLRPFGMANVTMLAAAFQGGDWRVSPGPNRERLITALAFACFATPMLGGLLLARRTTRHDPAVCLSLGAGLVATATMVLLYHPGQSQLDFMRSALPLLAGAGAWGITEGLAAVHWPAGAAATCVALGFVACTGLAWWAGTPYRPPPPNLTASAVLHPYILLIGLLGALTVALVAGDRRLRVRPMVSAFTLIALLYAGSGATRMLTQLIAMTSPTQFTTPLANSPAGPEQQAAIWLRENSSPTDVFATNVQCSNGAQPTDPGCLNLTFWVSAFAERRALLNGWGYTATAARLAAERPLASGYVSTVPFWDTERLHRNMALFAAPNQASASSLRADFGVTWLYADKNYAGLSRELDQVAILRYRNGPVSIYQIP